MGVCACSEAELKEGPVVLGNFTIRCPTGRPIPYPGFGTYLAKSSDTAAAVRNAIVAGYRHIDCAQVYCNEKEVGEGIKAGLDILGLPRESLYITSKVWNTHRREEHVREALEQTLRDLRCEYLDLYLINWPQSYQYLPKAEARAGVNCLPPNVGGASLAPELFPVVFTGRPPQARIPGGGDGKVDAGCVYPPSGVAFSETWAAMEEFVAKGKVKALGVSNFAKRHLEVLLETAKVPVMCNQIEHHPYLQQVGLKSFCAERGILVIGYATLLNPALQKEKACDLWEEPALVEVAEKHGKSVPQVLIRWAVQSDVVPIVKSTAQARIKENYNIHNFSLDDEDMQAINALECGWRYNKVPNHGVASAF